jgi:molecular chaperone DnaK
MIESVLGIDLGTSNSCVCVIQDGKPLVIPDEQGRKIQPSIVHIAQGGRITVGWDAKPALQSDPSRTIYASKRLIGRKFFSAEVKKAKSIMPYTIVEGSENRPLIEIDQQRYMLQEISAMILKKMKSIAEAHCQQTFEKAVVTVPAYFNDNQRAATMDAGKIAGLNIIRIINEPTAAALAYGYGKDDQQTVAVYDLGGGTFDISLLELGDGVFEVVSSAGDTYLGGEDFDDQLMDWMAEAYVKKHGIDLRSDPSSYSCLRDLAEKARIDLGDTTSLSVELNSSVCPNIQEPMTLPLSQNHLKQMITPLLQRSFQVCDEAFNHSDIRSSDVDGLILVGGPTRMPILREYVQGYFQLEPKQSIDPDQVVAIGAAIQGDILVGHQSDIVLVDLTPLSLGIEIRGGLLHRIVEINTPLPVDHTERFTTSVDNQKQVRISVYQGESKKATQNELLGEFVLDDLPPGPSGEVSIEVTFEIDTNGVLNVQAHNPETGKQQSIELIAAGRLERDRIKELGTSPHFEVLV